MRVTSSHERWEPMLKNRIVPGLVLALLCLAISCVLVACQGDDGKEDDTTTVKPVEVKVAVFRGPMSMGLAPFITSAQNEETHNSYVFVITPSWSEIKEALTEGTVDMAVVPVGAAATLYGETEGSISVVDTCALGETYVVSADSTIDSLDDLHGKDILMTSMGSATEFATQHLLTLSLGGDGVAFETLTWASDVVARLSSDPQAVAILAEPYASAAALYDTNLNYRLDLTNIWGEHVLDGSQLVTGVTVVRNSFADEHPEAVLEFVEGHAQATQDVLDDPSVKAQEAFDLGLVDTAELGEKMIPHAHLVVIRGEEMKQPLSAFLNLLFSGSEAYAESALPDDGFYRYV